MLLKRLQDVAESSQTNGQLVAEYMLNCRQVDMPINALDIKALQQALQAVDDLQ